MPATADRFALLAARAMNAPAGLVSHVDFTDGVLVFTGSRGLDLEGPSSPFSESICRRVVESGAVVSIDDVASDPEAAALPNVARLGIGAYLGAPVHGPGGSVDGVVCVLDFQRRAWTNEETELLQTIAESVRTELDLVNSGEATQRVAAEQQAIVAAALDCIVSMGEDGIVREFNPAAERTFGYSREQAVGRRLSELIVPPHLREAHETGLRRHLAEGTSDVLGRRLELTAMRADGSLLPVELTITKVEDPGGTVFVGFARDLTDLRAAQHRYRALIENMPLVTYVHSADEPFRTLYMSPQIEGMLGYTPEEWMAEYELVTSGIHPDDRERVAALAREARQHQVPTRCEFRFHARDGRTVWVLDQTIPIRNERGEVVAYQGFLLDVTERMELEDQLRQSQKMDAIGKLAGGIAHDFNNMLTAIGGYAELLALSMDADDPHAEDVDQIRKATDHAAALTRQLLAFSRKQVLSPQRLDPNEVVRELERMLARTIGADIDVMTALSPAAPAVEADPDQIARVVLNVALNARDAMPGGGTLSITTSGLVGDDGCFAVIEISDTGVGMDDETRLRVFEPFFTTKAAGKGTGLGLATAYGVIEQSGGRIEVESELGRGSTFRILLPAA